tara:strand:+ start:435 stop:722 length:288 start_codon:yes stop_codon:yes gene_type:complete
MTNTLSKLPYFISIKTRLIVQPSADELENMRKGISLEEQRRLTKQIREIHFQAEMTHFEKMLGHVGALTEEFVSHVKKTFIENYKKEHPGYGHGY